MIVRSGVGLVSTLALLALLLVQPASAAPSTTDGLRPDASVPIDRTDRQQVIDGYLWEYLWEVDEVPGLVPLGFGWNGSTSACTSGEIADRSRAASLRAINYFRAMAGIPRVQFEPTRDGQAQAAALVMAANQSLSHAPAQDWRCYSELARQGAANSNLILGATTVRGSVERYLDDSGAGNVAVGHRRWMLSPGAERMGFGATSTSNAVHVTHGNTSVDAGSRPIAYPMDGFWPAQLATSRWSLSYPVDAARQVDLTAAQVRVTALDRELDIEVVHRDEGGAGHVATLTWDVVDASFPDLVDSAGDTRFDVEVSGIRTRSDDGAWLVNSHGYAVTLVDALPPGFGDIASTLFARDIVWLQWRGIAGGCDGSEVPRFCPDAPVTRGQAAAFLSRALGLDEAPPAGFVDMAGHTFERDVDRLAAGDIAGGCDGSGEPRFCPDVPMTRGQMAAFLSRALELEAAPSVGFVDMVGHTFERDVDRLASAGVTAGCSGTGSRFCPDQQITRGQFAALLRRALS